MSFNVYCTKALLCSVQVSKESIGMWEVVCYYDWFYTFSTLKETQRHCSRRLLHHYYYYFLVRSFLRTFYWHLAGGEHTILPPLSLAAVVSTIPLKTNTHTHTHTSSYINTWPYAGHRYRLEYYFLVRMGTGVLFV